MNFLRIMGKKSCRTGKETILWIMERKKTDPWGKTRSEMADIPGPEHIAPHPIPSSVISGRCL